MKIDIYTIYKVKHKCKYSYRTGYDEFENDKFEVKREMQGGELMELLANLLKKENTDTFIQNSEGIVLITEFNPFSGETANHKIEYKEKGNVFEKEDIKNEKKK